MTLQALVLSLGEFWAGEGCLPLSAHDLPMADAAMHPAGFFGALGPASRRAVFLQPLRRPADGRFGASPDRAQRAYHYQVMLKPSPEDPQALCLAALARAGLPAGREVRFSADEWALPALGMAGAGSMLTVDGMPVVRLTYLQQVGGFPVRPTTAAVTYDLGQLGLVLQAAGSLQQMAWADPTDADAGAEVAWCRYNYDVADAGRLRAFFEGYEAEALACLEQGLSHPAYDCVLQCVRALDLLDSRRAVGAVERLAYYERTLALARRCAEAYLLALEAVE